VDTLAHPTRHLPRSRIYDRPCSRTPLRGWLGIGLPAEDEPVDEFVPPWTASPELAHRGINLDEVVTDISDNDIQGFSIGMSGRQGRLRTKGNKIDR
jgi:hypothetical protein